MRSVHNPDAFNDSEANSQDSTGDTTRAASRPSAAPDMTTGDHWMVTGSGIRPRYALTVSTLAPHRARWHPADWTSYRGQEMRRILCGALLCFAGAANAEALLCKGDFHSEGGQSGTGDLVFTVSEHYTSGSLRTLHGVATGSLSQNEKDYSGVFTTTDGTRYSLVLDRYTGELVLFVLGPPMLNEFMGTCQHAQPKF